MIIVAAQVFISSSLCVPDRRTRIRSETRSVLFTVYAPAGIGEPAVYEHLQDIQANVLLVAPAAEVEMMKVYGAGIS